MRIRARSRRSRVGSIASSRCCGTGTASPISSASRGSTRPWTTWRRCARFWPVPDSPLCSLGRPDPFSLTTAPRARSACARWLGVLQGVQIVLPADLHYPRRARAREGHGACLLPRVQHASPTARVRRRSPVRVSVRVSADAVASARAVNSTPMIVKHAVAALDCTERSNVSHRAPLFTATHVPRHQRCVGAVAARAGRHDTSMLVRTRRSRRVGHGRFPQCGEKHRV